MSKIIVPNVDNRILRKLGLEEHAAPAWMRITSGACQSDRATRYEADAPKPREFRDKSRWGGKPIRWISQRETLTCGSRAELAELLKVSPQRIGEALRDGGMVAGGRVEVVER